MSRLGRADWVCSDSGTWLPADSAIYRRNFVDFGESDELQHTVACRGRHLSAGCGHGDLFSDEERSRHAAAHPLVVAVLNRLAELLAPKLSSADQEVAGDIDSALHRFGSEVLTEREQAVIHLILRGHSSESVAQQLGTAWNTTRRHRARAYSKLGITSQGELFFAFLRSLGLGMEGP